MDNKEKERRKRYDEEKERKKKEEKRLANRKKLLDLKDIKKLEEISNKILVNNFSEKKKELHLFPGS